MKNGKPIAKREVPNDWRDLIGDDVYEYYINKTETHEKDGLFENDIAGVDIATMDTKKFNADLAHNAVSNKNQLWKDGTIPYTIRSGFSPEEESMIEGALQDITSKTCLKFVKQTSEQSYVTFVKSQSRCSSYIGRISRQQDIYLRSGCVNHFGEVQHEVMHALGFYHEQSRTDRDDYIAILWENIKPSQQDQFQKYRGDQMDHPYDYDSIMHYGWNAFAVDSQSPTILPIMKKKVSLGNRKVMSPLDVKKINNLYECSEMKSDTSPDTSSDTSFDTSTVTSSFTSTPRETSRKRRHKNRSGPLRIGSSDPDSDTLSGNDAEDHVKDEPNSGKVYIVVSGDTAYTIGQKYGLTLEAIRQLNPEKGDMEMIEVGDKIKIV